MANHRSGTFVGGFLLGALVGTVAGVLLAPRTGRETRQLLRKSADALPELAEDLSTTIQLQADRLSESAQRSWDGTLTRLKDAIAAGLEASRDQYADDYADEADDDQSESESPNSRPVRRDAIGNSN